MKYLPITLLFAVFAVALCIAPVAQPNSRMSLDQVRTDKSVKMETKINSNRAWFVEAVQ